MLNKQLSVAAFVSLLVVGGCSSTGTTGDSVSVMDADSALGDRDARISALEGELSARDRTILVPTRPDCRRWCWCRFRYGRWLDDCR